MQTAEAKRRAYANETPEQRDQRRAYARAYYQRNIEKERARSRVKALTYQGRPWRLKNYYGLTEAEWNSMFIQQDLCCAICETTEPGGSRNQWVTDHNHANDQPHARGILCHKCNVVLGMANDSVSILAKAIVYLEKHK